MPRYIDADALKDVVSEYLVIGIKPLLGFIDEQPTISPDELCGVVHCCHCLHAEPREPVGIKTEIFCRLLCAGMRKDDYCSYGKLRTNGAAHMEGNDDGTLDNP